MASKRKIKAKKQSFRIVIFGSVCLIIISGLLTTIANVWIEIYAKYKEKKELEDKILLLKQEEEEFEEEDVGMPDPPPMDDGDDIF